MIFKAVGAILFLAVLALKGTSWWDAGAFLAVFGGSAAVWAFYFFRGKEWDFLARNVSVCLGVVYGLAWELQIFVSYGPPFVCLAMIPVGYGLVLAAAAGLAYGRLHHAS